MTNNEYIATIGQEQYRISVGASSRISVNGQDFPIDFIEVRDHYYSLLLNGSSFHIALVGPDGSNDAEGDQPMQLTVNGREYSVTVDDKRSLLIKSLAEKPKAPTGSFVLKSPMPGLVVKVEVREGDDVVPGQGLVVLEAMKMENELKAPNKGKIVSVHVKPGLPVEKGEKLLTIRYA